MIYVVNLAGCSTHDLHVLGLGLSISHPPDHIRSNDQVDTMRKLERIFGALRPTMLIRESWPYCCRLSKQRVWCS